MLDEATIGDVFGKTFGGINKISVGETKTLLASNGLTWRGTCTQSTEDPTQNVASITISSDEAGTQYSSLNVFGGAVTEINPEDGPVTVFSYDAGCDEPGGPFYNGGIAFSLSKPSGINFNGVMSCGVGVLGGDAVFTGIAISQGG